MDSNCETIKKKRGRKKKVVDLITNSPQDNISISIEETSDHVEDPVLKKRGRKPKGGKLISKQSERLDTQPIVTNVILHLKCSMTDLNEYNHKINKFVTDPLTYNPDIPPSIMTYSLNDKTPFSIYSQEFSGSTTPNDKPETINKNDNDNNSNNNKNLAYEDYKPDLSKGSTICQCCSSQTDTKSTINGTSCENDKYKDDEDDADISMKDINYKLKKLKLQMYKSSNPDKKSACFWCTYDYDNQACYIPKYEMDGQIYGYGSFCRPECAAAYLMKENVDDSTKFERYHLLNQIYGKVYDYKKNIKPAPNPYFLLEKYYGNLSIQEYRKLLKTEHMLLVIDKPMTRILPELHEDNEEFIMNIYGGKTQTGNSAQTSGYKVKRQSEKQKGPSKTSIMKEQFGC